jgi:hypothetical protein
MARPAIHGETRVNKLAVLVLLVGVAACNNKKPEEAKQAPGAPPPSAVVGVPQGQSAGAANSGAAGGGSASGAKAEGAPANVGCATAATLACGTDQVDGCAGGLTAVHVCVAKDAKAGPPCAQEVALSCPADQVDACLHNPPQATTHVCVIVAKTTP